jgi:hypothetical protein
MTDGTEGAAAGNTWARLRLSWRRYDSSLAICSGLSTVSTIRS